MPTPFLLKEVILEVKQKVSPGLQEAAERFTSLYYGNIPAEDLAQASLGDLVNSVVGMWRFGFRRSPGEAKIRVFTEKKGKQTKLLPQTIVEIVNDDMPFLVDSVTGVINDLGYSTHLVIHPVIQVERDNSHAIKWISDRFSQTPKKTYESFIHCEILDFLDAEKRNILTHNLTRALQDVRVAVEDWGPMKERLKEAIINLKNYPPRLPSENREEYLKFCRWVEDNHFTFLGFCEYVLQPEAKTIKRKLISEGGLGILRATSAQEINKIFGGVDLTPANRRYIVEPRPLILTKTTQKSDVHRQDPMDSLTIKKFDKEGKVIGLYQFVGLFTSAAYRRSVRDIPLLREKVKYILNRSGFAEDWHDGKALIHILESFPRDEVFQASEEWLFDTSMAILQLQNRQRITLFVRLDKFERFVSCIVYIPRERYDSELRGKVAAILEKKFHGKLASWQAQLGELAFARVHYTLTISDKKSLIFDREAIENEIRVAARTWQEDLQKAVLDSVGEKKGLTLFQKYCHGFSRGYQEQFSVQEAVVDIVEAEKAFSKNRVQVYVSQNKHQNAHFLSLKIYTLESPLTLSEVLPLLENMGVKVLSETSFILSCQECRKIWIHNFEMKTQENEPFELAKIKENFLEALSRLLHNEAENDGFNRLILRANLTWRECQLIRAYAKYLRQVHGTFSQVYMEETLSKYPLMVRLMYQLFVCQFSPTYGEDREAGRSEILKKIKGRLAKVQALDEDRILRKFINVMGATLRTNFYQVQDNQPKSYVSFKVDCHAIEDMPLPRPKYEIFVYSPQVEAIHLRGDNIARGGIRWSNRREDFRTEILGLMKAQVVKNAVIVPSGSKGGFIIKHSASTRVTQKEGIQGYEIMIRGLLDLTDNIKDGSITSPPNVICRDKNDPYLVVAADKGTSTFSDHANHISAEYNFWLGDAFASGGKAGYDHKKMGITSRGVWESVKRHFQEMGRDATIEQLTVVGIGDMSGDVFGNGMLLSRHLRLVAAFNHLHIFIDPFPDPEKSYQERKRLFNLPSSTWADYNRELISPGGGVFERDVKSLRISPQMKTVLEISEDYLSSPKLLQLILRARVDLLWFGGIGTYIKAQNESSLDVGDPANDAIRINGKDARAQVIAEGANLGVTQLGRIEYAKKGGRLNTDAIDNSAGVDCSDHEVNIKIPLNQVMDARGCSFEKRNLFLRAMTDDVARLVLKDNFWQVQAISLAHNQGVRLLEEQAHLMRDLEEEGLLNRSLEHLPDEAEIARRKMNNQGLTRPELAVLLAYTKISLKHHLLQSNILEIGFLRNQFLTYFPTQMRDMYPEELESHPLRREITATFLTNTLINRMGITFIHEMKRQVNVDVASVTKAYFLVRELLDLSSLWRELEGLKTLSTSFQAELMLSVYETVKRFTDWFLRSGEAWHDVEGQLKQFKAELDVLKVDLFVFFPHEQRKIFEENVQAYMHKGLSRILANRLLALPPLGAAPDIIMLSKELSLNITLVAKVYFAIGQQLKFDWLRKATMDLPADTQWEQDAVRVFLEDWSTIQQTITKKILKKTRNPESLFTESGKLVSESLPTSEAEGLFEEITKASVVDCNMLTVIKRQLQMLC